MRANSFDNIFFKIFILSLFSICFFQSYSRNDEEGHSIRLEEFTFVGKRPLSEIGIQKTVFDSLALKENIALSMADILAFNSSVFVKNYGRATLSTVAFRGTSPSHTQVTWNGMKINNPMLGMTDFSTIPAYFVDQASLLHGTSSINESGGGLGGLIKLSTIPDAPDGFNLQYIQGIGSFRTFDEFLRLTYHNTHFTNSTRVVYSSSPNDYTYINRDKKLNIYDDEHNIIGQYYPKEKNKSGAYKDLHLLEELYYTTGGNRLGLNIWYINSNRELPLLTTDYGTDRNFENRQKEQTIRSVISWNYWNSPFNFSIRAGYIHTNMAYDYRREITEGNWAELTHSRSKVNTVYGQGEFKYSLLEKWLFNANISAHQHFVRSEDKNIILQDGDKAIVGYDKARLELDGLFSVRYQPSSFVGLSAVLRGESAGDKVAPLIPAFFVDWLPINTVAHNTNLSLTFKGSISRNYRFPTLNDLYFLPGGNPDLKSEEGFTYDLGFEYKMAKGGTFALNLSANWFDSYIDDWIMWLPTTKGFFSPRNVKSVHAYGIETKCDIGIQPFKEWFLDFNGSFSWTPSINRGEKISPADQSVGKQLPYVPEYSASFTARLTYKSWSFLYKWNYYSKRYTMSSNDYTLSGQLPEYFMNNISVEKNFIFKPLDIQLKLAVNNLFNEKYLSVLAHPMPGINFEFFIGITPKFLSGIKKELKSNQHEGAN